MKNLYPMASAVSNEAKFIYQEKPEPTNTKVESVGEQMDKLGTAPNTIVSKAEFEEFKKTNAALEGMEFNDLEEEAGETGEQVNGRLPVSKIDELLDTDKDGILNVTERINSLNDRGIDGSPNSVRDAITNGTLPQLPTGFSIENSYISKDGTLIIKTEKSGDDDKYYYKKLSGSKWKDHGSEPK